MLMWLLGTAACREAPPAESPGGPLTFALAKDAGTAEYLVSITGWSPADLRALSTTRMPQEAWSEVVRLTVEDVADIAVA